jgi:hypothetical protein
MQSVRWPLSTVALALAGLLACSSLGAPPAEGTAGPARLGLYAANFNARSVTEYALDASGNTAPLRTIGGPHTGITNVRDVAVDAAGDIYTVNLSGPTFINVFARTARGDATPLRQIGGLATLLSDPLALALDAQGYLYVANQTEEGPPAASILVFAPGAHGDAAPVRQITGAGEAVKLAVDRAGDLVVAVTGSFGQTLPNQILTYAPGTNGAATPIRRLAGLATQLGSGSSLTPFAVAVAPGELRVRAAGSGTGTPRVNVYPAGATGDVAPQFSLSGPATHLGETDALAVDSALREYVANAAANAITVYPSNAAGNTPPLRAIAGTSTGLDDPLGLAIGPR